jgi:hypothetical protein
MGKQRPREELVQIDTPRSVANDAQRELWDYEGQVSPAFVPALHLL